MLDEITGAVLASEEIAQYLQESHGEPLESRGILVVNRGRVRVRNRNVLRYYARSIEHLIDTRSHRLACSPYSHAASR